MCRARSLLSQSVCEGRCSCANEMRARPICEGLRSKVCLRKTGVVRQIHGKTYFQKLLLRRRLIKLLGIVEAGEVASIHINFAAFGVNGRYGIHKYSHATRLAVSNNLIERWADVRGLLNFAWTETTVEHPSCA